MNSPAGKQEEVRTEIPTKAQVRDFGDAQRILQDWFRRKHPELGDLRVNSVQMPKGAGVANETLLVDVTVGSGQENPRRYVVRVDSPEHLFMNMDIKAHYGMYDVLSRETDIPAPKVLGFEDNKSLLGQRFFLMEFIDGRVPPDDPPFHRAGWVTEVSPEARHAMWRNTIAVMARMHRLDVEKFAFLKRPHLGRSGLEQEFRHWVKYAEWCGSHTNAIIEHARKWLADHFPDDPPTALSWGDSRVPNVIFQGTEVAAILDWDMVSLAGPEMDLAWWTIMDQPNTACRGLPRLSGFGTPAETIALWEELSKRKAKNMQWYAVFNAYRLSSILIRLPTMLKAQGLLAPEAEYMFTNNTGIQWLCGLLDLPPAGPLTTPWVGWDK